jgi:hypothetical protein
MNADRTGGSREGEAAMQSFTLIDVVREVEVPATVEGDAVRVPADALAEATGWVLKPQGFCKDDACIPVRDAISGPAPVRRSAAPMGVAFGSGLTDERGIDLAAFARLLDRPLARDVAERVACLGASASERAARLATFEAPDFSLPDLEGRIHSFSDHRGRKVLLVAYASW